MTRVLAVVGDAGALLPASLMDSGPVRVLAAFVAINTVMYAALALAKILPRVHPSSWFQGANRRAQERSIYPAGSAACPGDSVGDGADHAADDRRPRAEVSGEGPSTMSGTPR